jgi:hypothetical protein
MSPCEHPANLRKRSADLCADAGLPPQAAQLARIQGAAAGVQSPPAAGLTNHTRMRRTKSARPYLHLSDQEVSGFRWAGV